MRATFEDWDVWHYGSMIRGIAVCGVEVEVGMMVTRRVEKVTCPKCLKCLEGSDTVPTR